MELITVELIFSHSWFSSLHDDPFIPQIPHPPRTHPQSPTSIPSDIHSLGIVAVALTCLEKPTPSGFTMTQLNSLTRLSQPSQDLIRSMLSTVCCTFFMSTPLSSPLILLLPVAGSFISPIGSIDRVIRPDWGVVEEIKRKDWND